MERTGFKSQFRELLNGCLTLSILVSDLYSGGHCPHIIRLVGELSETLWKQGVNAGASSIRVSRAERHESLVMLPWKISDLCKITQALKGVVFEI